MSNKPTPASQREILTGQTSPTFNRGNDVQIESGVPRELNIGLKDLDYSIEYYLKNVIQPTINDNGTIRPVPIYYGSPEKWKNFQADGYLRDREDKILAPIIAYKRTTVAKNRTLGSKVDANHPQVYYTQQVKYTQQNRYDQFSKLTNQKPVKTFVNTVMADFVDLTYEVIVWTDYVSHMNEIVEAILYSEGSFWGEEERFKFRTKIDSFTNTTDLLVDNERIVRTNFTLTLFGYIVPDVRIKQLSDKLSEVTYSAKEVVMDVVVPNVSATGATKTAISLTSQTAVFETVLNNPNAGSHDFYVEINGQQVLATAIESITQTPNNTVTIGFNVAQLGYTLIPGDNVTVTGKYIN